MALKVDLKEFSANSPFDYAELNKLVFAVRAIAAAMPEISNPGAVDGSGNPTPGPGTGNAVPQRVIYAGYDSFTAPRITTTENGYEYDLKFHKQVNGVRTSFSFSSPPWVMLTPHSSGNESTGIPVVCSAGSVAVDGIKVRGGFVGADSKFKTGTIGFRWLAIGYETAS
jgi:hypothetical protein